MPLARWKDLCVDATDTAATAGFWAPALGLVAERHPRRGTVTRLGGERPEQTIWVNQVPEPKTVKNRVHADIRDDLDRLLALGATVLRAPDDEIPWHVLADPEGAELCLFERRPDWPGGDGFFELVVDTVDPAAQAAWWADVLGGRAGSRDGVPWSWVEDAPGTPFLFLVFRRSRSPSR